MWKAQNKAIKNVYDMITQSTAEGECLLKEKDIKRVALPVDIPLENGCVLLNSFQNDGTQAGVDLFQAFDFTPYHLGRPIQ